MYNDQCTDQRVECPNNPGFFHGYTFPEIQDAINNGARVYDTDCDRIVHVQEDGTNTWNAYYCERVSSVTTEELMGANWYKLDHGRFGTYYPSNPQYFLVEQETLPLSDADMSLVLRSLGVSNLPPAAAFHAAADNTNDAEDHDELHAAGAVVESGVTDSYIERWLNGLAERHQIHG